MGGGVSPAWWQIWLRGRASQYVCEDHAEVRPSKVVLSMVTLESTMCRLPSNITILCTRQLCLAVRGAFTVYLL